MNVKYQRAPRAHHHATTNVVGGGGLFSLVDSHRINPPAVGTHSNITFPPAPSKSATRPPAYVPPSTAPSGLGLGVSGGPNNKQFAPPLHALRPPTSSSTSAPVLPTLGGGVEPNHNFNGSSSSNKRYPSASQLGGGKPSTPMTGVREQAPVPPLRRPPSTGTGSGAHFHKGLVNALQDVLRKQRQGVFPGPDGVDEPCLARPATQGGAPSESNRIDELIRRKKNEWAQKRWQNNQQSERRDMERGLSSANTFLRRNHRNGSAQQHSNTTASSCLYDDDELGLETMQMVGALERQERVDRDDLTQQFLRSTSDMITNFTTFIRAKMLMRPDSAHQGWNAQPRKASIFAAGDGDTADTPLSPGLLSRPVTGSPQHRTADAQRAAAVEELRQQGNRMYEQNDFCGAHVLYTKAMALDKSGEHSAVLLANRAATNMMLLHYDACAKDCMAALALEHTNVKIIQRLAKAYALVGQHRLAANHYANALKYAQDQGASAAFCTTLQDEAASSVTLEKMRRALELDSHAECVALSTSLRTFQGEPPVVYTRCSALLAVDPSAARQELSRYFATLECPTAYTSPSASADSITLSGAYGSHYCDVLVLLARASFYCGQHYLHIASTYVKQCLAMRPEHRHAQHLGKILTSIETKMEEAHLHFASNKFAEAHAALSMALALDSNNKKIRGALFNSRAEASVKLGNVAAAISDCTSSLECDPSLVKALTRRAKCFSEIGDFSRAVRDMERAAELNPSLADDVRSFRAQQRADNASYTQFHRRFSAGPNGRQQGSDDGAGEWANASRPGTGRTSSNAPLPFLPSFTCHYNVLLLPRFSTIDQVKAQYKKLILQNHPDKLVNQPQEVRDACAIKFRAISEAYAVLVDPNTKLQYDNVLR